MTSGRWLRTLQQSFAVLLAAGMAGVPATASDKRCVTDDRDREVCLDEPAKRIAGLSPGATELLWEAGAGEQLVARVAHSDYPEEVKEVASVGSHTRIDMEALVELEPDLVIGWVTGNPREQLDKIEALGLPVFYIEPRDFEGVASTVRRLARLAGTEEAGDEVAEAFLRGMEDLEARYRDADPVDVFYQVWDEPLMTVNNGHLIGKAIELCGGRNVFADESRLVPRIGTESVLDRDPEAIVAGGMGEENRDWLDFWEQYESLTAVSRDNLFFVPPSHIQRPTPRLLKGTGELCEHLETARERRND